MASTDLVPYPSGGRDAFGEFLRHAIPYEKAGRVLPRDLLQFGVYGSVAVIAAGLLALIFPSPTSIRHAHFFLVLRSQEADLQSLLRALAVPAIVCGVALLVLDAFLMYGRRAGCWPYAVVGQAGLGGVGGALGTIFLALV